MTKGTFDPNPFKADYIWLGLRYLLRVKTKQLLKLFFSAYPFRPTFGGSFYIALLSVS